MTHVTTADYIKGGFPWKQSIFKIGNWWEEMTEPISNKSARRKNKQELNNDSKRDI